MAPTVAVTRMNEDEPRLTPCALAASARPICCLHQTPAYRTEHRPPGAAQVFGTGLQACGPKANARLAPERTPLCLALWATIRLRSMLGKSQTGKSRVEQHASTRLAMSHEVAPCSPAPPFFQDGRSSHHSSAIQAGTHLNQPALPSRHQELAIRTEPPTVRLARGTIPLRLIQIGANYRHTKQARELRNWQRRTCAGLSLGAGGRSRRGNREVGPLTTSEKREIVLLGSLVTPLCTMTCKTPQHS